MVNLCNIDGEITPEAEARIPVLDRGFLFGDSVYEVIRTRDGRPFAWREHLDRLTKSAEGLALPLDCDQREVCRRIAQTIEQSGPGERYVRIIVSRGTGTAPNIDLSYAPGPSRTIIMVRDLPTPAKLAKLAIVPRLRTDRRALDPAIKSGNYLNNVLGLAEAKAAGATDCVFLNADGDATEASTSNFFLVRAGGVVTPPLSAGLLAGITRGLVFECAVQNGLTIAEENCSAGELVAADEMFLTSTMRDIAPVTHIDGQPIHGGEPGPITQKLASAFAAFCHHKVHEVDGPAFDELVS